MSVRIITFCLATFWAMSGSASEKAQRPEWEQLQGRWTYVSTEEDGKVKSGLLNPYTLIVNNETVRLMEGNQLLWVASIRQVAGGPASPVKYNLIYDRTNPLATVKFYCNGDSYGILQIRGDELKMCAAPGPDDSVRPKGFDSMRHAVAIWHRKP